MEFDSANSGLDDAVITTRDGEGGITGLGEQESELIFCVGCGRGASNRDRIAHASEGVIGREEQALAGLVEGALDAVDGLSCELGVDADGGGIGCTTDEVNVERHFSLNALEF